MTLHRSGLELKCTISVVHLYRLFTKFSTLGKFLASSFWRLKQLSNFIHLENLHHNFLKAQPYLP